VVLFRTRQMEDSKKSSSVGTFLSGPSLRW
jgi:hypothetical protein